MKRISQWIYNPSPLTSRASTLSFFLFSYILKIYYIRDFVFFPEFVFQTARIILMTGLYGYISCFIEFSFFFF
jgi:hypothetical protein